MKHFQYITYDYQKKRIFFFYNLNQNLRPHKVSFTKFIFFVFKAESMYQTWYRDCCNSSFIKVINGKRTTNNSRQNSKGHTFFSKIKKRTKSTCFTKCSLISRYTPKTSSILYMTCFISAVAGAWYVTFHAINTSFSTPYGLRIYFLLIYREIACILIDTTKT